VSAATVTGDMPMNERDEIINDFKSGKIMALTNAQVLTTGFDYPDIDLIAMLRPTMSPGLYMQMAGRGMRPKSHTDHCLVLDFAGVVETHGPITCVRPPNKAGEGTGEAPVKVCANCGELCHLAAKVCPACGTAFPPSEPPKLKLRDDDIMGVTSKRLDVQTWSWRTHVSRSSGKEMLACTYYGELSDAPVREYFVVKHEGYAGSRALQEVAKIAYKAGVSPKYQDLDEICLELNKGNPPVNVRFVNDGKFYKVTRRLWTDDLLSLNS
jgi:DNA repair protein RadD